MNTENIINSITVGIMCFNEQDSLESTFIQLYDFLQKYSFNFEIIIVNDGSSDNSNFICENLSHKYENVFIITHPTNLGIGQTLRSIYFNSNKKWVVNIPADGQFDINELKSIVLSDNEFVAFYRRDLPGYTFSRKMLSFCNKKLLQIFLRIKIADVNWVKVYPSTFFKNNSIYLKSSLVESEIIYKLLNLNFSMRQLSSNYLIRKKGISRGASYSIVKNAIFDIFNLIYVCKIKDN